jgi:hypothetical protein
MSEKICFVIAPIGPSDSEIRKRSDQILKHIIEPAASECGYAALRADKIDEPGLITSQVIQHVVDDALVIADLTGRNPNVFYELAVRHAIRKPLVQIIAKGEQIPFDVAGTRTVELDHKDLDSVAAAKQEIVLQIRSLEKDPSKLHTPISVAIDLQALRQSDNPEQRTFGEVLEAIGELRASLTMLGSRVEYAIDLAAKTSARQETAFADYNNYGVTFQPGAPTSFSTLLTAPDDHISNLKILSSLSKQAESKDQKKRDVADRSK